MGIEIDPVYVDVAIRRWQAFTGKEARQAGENQTFSEVEAMRSAAGEAAGRNDKPPESYSGVPPAPSPRRQRAASAKTKG